MEKGIRTISFNIYADDDKEAEKGRMAIIQFINTMGMNGAMVSGNKISEAMAKLNSSPFIATQIINFFKK